MNAIFKLMIFSIMLNLATGMILYNIVDWNGNSVFDLSDTRGLYYSGTAVDEFNSSMGGTVYPSGVVETKGNAIYRILDTINLGFIKKFIDTVDKYMFGFVNVLMAIIGDLLGTGKNFLINVVIKGAITVGYTLAAWQLWTGKRIADD